MINIELLKNYANIKKVAASSILVEDGNPLSTFIYIILAGKAGVFKNYGKPNEIMIYQLSPGEFFGETSLLQHKKPSADIVALDEITVLEITKDNAYRLFGESPEATLLLIQSLCARIDNLDNSCLRLHAKLYPKLHQETDFKPVNIDEALHYMDQGYTDAATPSSSLFPEGHQNYILPPAELKDNLILSYPYICPMCEHEFSFPSVRTSKIKALHTDNDLRVHYEGVNLTHYLVLTCPECLFSTIASDFDKAMASRSKIVRKALAEYKDELQIDFSIIDANTIFARLYLALVCMPLCYSNHALYTARLWLNICWLYRDCGAANMEKYAAEKAMQAYTHVFSSVRLDKKNEQRICIIIGELYFKLEDYIKAREYFFLAKVNKEGVQHLVDLAEDRITDIKQLI